MPDGRIQVRAKGVVLPCSIFDPHQQRVTHAAVTENKHLSAVLAHIKKEQDKAAPSPEVKPSSARNGYKKNGRRNNGWNTLADQKRVAKTQSQPGLRYLMSPPCQALLPSRPMVTLLLCKHGDISTWLQQRL